jgi:hypothetical protein
LDITGKQTVSVRAALGFCALFFEPELSDSFHQANRNRLFERKLNGAFGGFVCRQFGFERRNRGGLGIQANVLFKGVPDQRRFVCFERQYVVADCDQPEFLYQFE